MTDRPNDPPANELELLVAAYVDGEATPDERARVEGDPALLALVERHRAAKAAVADVRPLSRGRRDSLLAAALTEHAAGRSPADGPVDTDATSAAPVRPIPPPAALSHRSMRWLGAAAAIIAVLAGFAALASVLGNGDDDDAGGAEATVEQSNDGDTADTTDGRSVADDGQFDTGSRAGDEAQPPTVQEQQIPDVAGAPGTTTAAEATAAGSATATTGATGAPTPETVSEAGGDSQRRTPPDDGGTVVRLRRGSDLLDWYDRVADGDLVPPGAGSRACGETILGWAQVEQGDQFVVVARRPGNQIVALDVETNCSTLFIAQVD
jgi:hypothetical protein